MYRRPRGLPGRGASRRLRSLPCLLLLIASLLLTSGSAWADFGVNWDRLQVDAHLDDNGFLHVREIHEITVFDDTMELGRVLSHAPAQELGDVRILRLLDDGGEHAFSLVEELTGPGQYVDYGWHLRWSLPPPPSEAAARTLRYVVEYRLTGALTPAWDLAHATVAYDPHFGPDLVSPLERAREVWAGWQDAADCLRRCYRLDFDVHLPTRDSGPNWPFEELSWRFAWSTAWRRLQPERDLGRVEPGQNLRLQATFEFLGEGRPRAVDPRQPVLRFATVAALPLACLLLLLPFLLFDVPRRARRARLDRPWFEANVLTQPPELVSTRLYGRVPARAFERMLERLAAAGHLDIKTWPRSNNPGGPAVELRLLTDPRELHPLEREVIETLFGDRRELHSDQLREQYPPGSFDPGWITQSLLLRAAGHKRQVRVRRRWAGVLLVLLLLAGLLTGTYAMAVDHEGPYAMGAGMVGFFLMAAVIPTRWWYPGRRLLAALFWLPLVLLPPLVVAVLHLVPTVPPGLAAGASLSLLVLAGFFFALMRIRAFDDEAEQRYWLLRARRWARRELARGQFPLEQPWLAQLEGLGLGAPVSRARHRRSGSTPAGLDDTAWSTPLYR